MRHRKRLNWITVLLALFLLTSCTRQPVEPPPDETGEEPPEDPVHTEPAPEGYAKADSIFSINYSPNASMNPLTGTDYYNEQLFGLLYEGLFALDRNLRPFPVLCESCTTEDGLSYDMTVKSGVLFHDGSPLTVSDVVYTLNIARGTAKYRSRLADIESVSETGEDSFRITLRRANYSLPSLLDVPILQNGAADELQPTGTGPYRFSTGRLMAFTSYRDYSSDTLRTIYLKDADDAGLAEAFSDRSVDLVGYDPTGLHVLNVHMVHETRYYNTTDFLYLGFNCTRGVTADPAVRRTLMSLVNTETICEDIYDNAVLRSPSILSPVLDVYDSAWIGDVGYSRQEFTRLCKLCGLEDADYDGYLEYIPGSGDFKLRMIVNSDSPYKVAAARRIATDMQNMGLDLTLDILSWSAYTAALADGDFDLYLGEVRLRADFDMTPLLTVGGSLNYGKINDFLYDTLIEDFLSAPDEASRANAARNLCQYVALDVPLVPIAYKQYAVLTHVGVVSGADPSQSNIFSNISSWQFNIK